MKPRIDISAQKSFTIWESGRWNDKEALGRATLIAGPEGEKLHVIFDTDPTRNNFHYLFFARDGQVVATVFIRKKGTSQFQYDLRLSRIEQLTTEDVQGNQVARATMETLWMFKYTGSSDYASIVTEAYDKAGGKKPVYLELLLQAVEKAFTRLEDQRLFWGIPRETNRDF